MSFATKSTKQTDYKSVDVSIYVQDKANTKLSKSLYDYLDKNTKIVKMDESIVEDKLFYNIISAAIVIPEDFDNTKKVQYKIAPDNIYATDIKEKINIYLSQVNSYEKGGFTEDEAIKNANDDLNKEGSTIIYTSHYMDEVDFLCDDIVIIDKGKVIAKGTSEQLKDMIEMNEKISFTSKDLSEDIINKIKALPHLLEFQNKNGSVKLDFAHGDGYLMKLVKLLDEENIQYSSLNVEKPSLNDVFLELTGKDLRD